jgi:hypothetical protein
VHCLSIVVVNVLRKVRAIEWKGEGGEKGWSVKLSSHFTKYICAKVAYSNASPPYLAAVNPIE